MRALVARAVRLQASYLPLPVCDLVCVNCMADMLQSRSPKHSSLRVNEAEHGRCCPQHRRSIGNGGRLERTLRVATMLFVGDMEP